MALPYAAPSVGRPVCYGRGAANKKDEHCTDNVRTAILVLCSRMFARYVFVAKAAGRSRL